MGQACRRFRFAMKADADVWIVFEIGRQHFQRDVASHGVVMRAVDHAHRAAADPFDHLIAPDPFWQTAARAIFNGHRHGHWPEQRATRAVMLSRLPCARAVLISAWATAGNA